MRLIPFLLSHSGGLSLRRLIWGTDVAKPTPPPAPLALSPGQGPSTGSAGLELPLFQVSRVSGSAVRQLHDAAGVRSALHTRVQGAHRTPAPAGSTGRDLQLPTVEATG